MQQADPRAAGARHRAATPHVHDPVWHARHMVYLAQQRLERAEHERNAAQATVDRARHELDSARANQAALEPAIG